METLKFKTNINCGGCIAAVTPLLNNLQEVENWGVDIASPNKVLSVQVKGGLSAAQIISTLKQKGYKAEKI